MRASVASLSKKFISTFFAATLALGLVPAAAFAVDDDGLQSIPEGSEGAVPVAFSAEEEGRDVLALPSDADPSADGDGADSTSEDVTDTNDSQGDSVATGSTLSDGEDGAQGDTTTGDDTQAAIPAAGVINQKMPLEVVAQQESTRSYFLAQTLESTKTVPIVSANLPLDKGTNQEPQAGADGGTSVGSEDKVTDGDPSVSAEGEGSSEDEGGEDSDESDLGSSDGAATACGVSGESTVVGSFTYLGMTFAVEPGGESVALVAVDYSKLPEEFVQKQILAVPEAATPDGMDYYSVTRIATNAFSSLTKENADPDYTGCIELFSDEELLGEAGIDPSDVAEFLPQDEAAAATDDGGSADADSDMQREDESPRYGEQATSDESWDGAEDSEGEAAIISDTVSLSNGEDESTDGIRTIVSMEGNVATLDDGSTYTFTNPLEGCAGILALGIPASVSNIEDDAFVGADTLQYLVVSEGNPEYASFDGALYSADMTNLRLIPEGRVGAVRVASSATGVDPEVFSHCPSVDVLVADAEGIDYQLLYLDPIFGRLIRRCGSMVVSEVSGQLSFGIRAAALALNHNWYINVPYWTDEVQRQITSDTVPNWAPGTYPIRWANSNINHVNFYLGSRSYGAYGANTNPYSTASRVSAWYYLTEDPDSVVQSIRFGGVTYSPASPGSWYAGSQNSSSTNCFIFDNVFVTVSDKTLGSVKVGSGQTGYLANANSSISLPTPQLFPGSAQASWKWEILDFGNVVDSGFLPSDAGSFSFAEYATCAYKTSYVYRLTAELYDAYQVSWITNNGETISSWPVPIDGDHTLNSSSMSDGGLPSISRNGWRFAGWFRGVNGEECSYEMPADLGDVIEKDAFYHARWLAVADWDANGGLLSENETSQVFSISYDGSEGAENRAGFVAPEAPTAPAGWEFAGWADTAEPRAGEVLVQPGETIYNHLLTDEAKAGDPTFYARYKAEVSFGTSRGAGGDTGLADMPATRTVYAKAPVDGAAPVGAISASEIANAASQKWYRFLGYKAEPSAEANTPGSIVWYRYGTQGEDGFSLDLPEGTVAPGTATDIPGADDETASYADDMTFTVRGDTVFTLLWAPIAYKATFDAGKSEYTSAPGTVTGMGSWAIDTADPAPVPDGQTSRAWTYAYTYDMTTVNLPHPVLAGYTYDFTSDSGSLLGGDAASALESRSFDAKTAVRAADPAGTGASPRTLSFAVTWTKSPYEVQVEGTAFPMGGGYCGFDAAGQGLVSIPFNGATGITVPQLHPASTRTDDQAYFDDDYMASFDGWTIGVANGAGGYTFPDGATKHASIDIPLDELDAFFADNAWDSTHTKVVVKANFTPRTWRAAIQMPTGASIAPLPEGWNANGNGASRTYTCETDGMALPGIAEVKRFGYTLVNWTVTPTKDGQPVEGVPAYTVNAVDGSFSLPRNTIYDLSITPNWKAVNSTIELVAGTADDIAAGATISGTTRFAIDFGQAMTEGIANGTAVSIPQPTWADHTFLGFFDENGRQYITAQRTSARTWDKTPASADETFMLYARWQDNDLNGDGSPDDPQTVVVATPPSTVTIRSTDTVSSAPADVLVSEYAGTMQWNSAAAFPRSFDTVALNIASYDMTPAKVNAIRTAFSENTGVNTGKWILGFNVGSNGSYVPFSDLIYGNLITLSLAGTDIDRSGVLVAPSISIAPSTVTVVWGDKDPDYGDGSDPSQNPGNKGLEAGDQIVNVFDAGMGTMDDHGTAKKIMNVVTTVGAGYVAGTSHVLTTLPTDPVCAGYEFLGWSRVPQSQHTGAACGEFKNGKGDIPEVTSHATKTYYAHWAPHTYTIELDANGGVTDNKQVTWAYGTKTDQPAASGFEREGYTCIGFFDTPQTSGGTLYLDREGNAKRAWDKGKTANPTEGVTDYRLYARWVSTSAAGDGETDPANPPSTDPFPGVPGNTTTVPTTSTEHAVRVAARAGDGTPLTVFDGTYEGVFRFRQVAPVADDGRPASSASVQVMFNYYEPAAGPESRMAELAEAQKAFEARHGVEGEHLQGFRVMSTGDFISWADIMAGTSIDIDCMGSDLTWGEAGITTPASFNMKAMAADGTHLLVAVYGTTPCVDPDDGETEWPQVGTTEVVVNFDAGAGRFGNGARFVQTKTVLGGTVVLPEGTPSYKPTEGWSFSDWVDAGGANVTASTRVPGVGVTTYYAKYTQKTWTLSFVLSDESDSDVLLPEGTTAADLLIGEVTGEARDVHPYDKQSFDESSANGIKYPLPSSTTFSRPGYELLGWFTSPDAADANLRWYKLTEAGKDYVSSGKLAVVSSVFADGSTMQADTTAYALWAPRTFSVTLHWNYPAYSVGGVEHPPTAGTDADIIPDPDGDRSALVYGQRVDAALIAAPENARYQFIKWAASTDGSAPSIVGASGTFQPASGGGYWFVPQNLGSDGALHFYAIWNLEAASEYQVKLFPGEGGTYGGGKDPKELSLFFDDPDYLLPVKGDNNYPSTINGWAFKGWAVADEHGAAVEPITMASKVESGSTGDRFFVALWERNDYTVRLTNVDGLLPDDYPLDAPLDWDNTWSHGFKVDDATSWALPTEAQMNELNTKQSFPWKGQQFVGWRDANTGAMMADGARFVPATYISGFTNYELVTDAVFEAVWKPKTYTVVLDTNTGDKQQNNLVYQLEYGEANKMALPIPVLHGFTGVFSHWDIQPNADRNAAWVAGYEVSIPNILEDGRYGERNVVPKRTVVGVLEDGTAVNQEMENVITLYARWNQALSADVPLVVSIAVDPNSGDMMFAEGGYLRTNNSDLAGVAVEGLTYEKVTASDDAYGGGTDAVFGSVLDSANLTVSAARADGVGTEGFLRIPLKERGQWTRDDLEAAGFPVFDWRNRLDIVYGLDFGLSESMTEEERRAALRPLFAQMNLPMVDGSDLDANGMSNVKYRIAKVFYTIGLVREGAQG